MKKVLSFIAICLSFVFFCSLVGCVEINKSDEDSNKEVIELTTDNWNEYLAYQEITNTSSVIQSSLLGFPHYKAEGTYTVKFYSISDVKFENVNITIGLVIYTIAYSSSDKSGIALSDRIPDDWYFTNDPLPTKDFLGGTQWKIVKSGRLSNNGEISFSEPCKMAFTKTDWRNYGTLESAIDIVITDISGQIIIEK